MTRNNWVLLGLVAVGAVAWYLYRQQNGMLSADGNLPGLNYPAESVGL